MGAVATNGNGASTPTLPEEVSKPPEGVVLPPKDIRGEWSSSSLPAPGDIVTNEEFSEIQLSSKRPQDMWLEMASFSKVRH